MAFAKHFDSSDVYGEHYYARCKDCRVTENDDGVLRHEWNSCVCEDGDLCPECSQDVDCRVCGLTVCESCKETCQDCRKQEEPSSSSSSGSAPIIAWTSPVKKEFILHTSCREKHRLSCKAYSPIQRALFDTTRRIAQDETELTQARQRLASTQKRIENLEAQIESNKTKKGPIGAKAGKAQDY